MAKVLLTESIVSGIADALRAKSGGSGDIMPKDMPDAVMSLPDAPRLVSRTITSNGTYTASGEGADGYGSLVVAVPVVGMSFGSSSQQIAGYPNGTASASVDTSAISYASTASTEQ